MGIKGTSDNIRIYPLAPSAIGVELETLMEKRVKNPQPSLIRVAAVEPI
jgi:hypothetical protein